MPSQSTTDESDYLVWLDVLLLAQHGSILFDPLPDLTDLSIPDDDYANPDYNEEPVPEEMTADAEARTELMHLLSNRCWTNSIRTSSWVLFLTTIWDEKSILEDEDSDEDREDSDAGSVENDTEVLADQVDEDPVTFELDTHDLNHIQEEEWDYFEERPSGQALVDAAPLYDGSSGPTKAALVYAENPLAIFYFFLPKELWSRIADETNKYRPDSADEVTQGMHRSAREKRLTKPLISLSSCWSDGLFTRADLEMNG
ncbi:hypothetical protein F442_22274 [Phytophthora nicotianae P10297]|uniref:PiggyBac transposable element-derived protein domain-containing protein n=2 Tax=Phytophthora nicotianae TaxID=4792 RepID=W2Y2K4_PHYNI|nr:hypothetical protein F444_23019 [Phytophthora nicotianae P1976]ETP28429.1 hypothetical protein F442_22274 [Phytophthora nicotianae P10297]